MGGADIVCFAEGWEEARGCRIERNVATEYEITIMDENGMAWIPKGSVNNPVQFKTDDMLKMAYELITKEIKHIYGDWQCKEIQVKCENKTPVYGHFKRRF